jgi:hypothetical protein
MRSCTSLTSLLASVVTIVNVSTGSPSSGAHLSHSPAKAVRGHERPPMIAVRYTYSHLRPVLVPVVNPRDRAAALLAR